MGGDQIDDGVRRGPIRSWNRPCIASAYVSGLIALGLILCTGGWAAPAHTRVSNASAERSGPVESAVPKSPRDTDAGMQSDPVRHKLFGSLESTNGPFPDTGALVGILANPEPYYGNSVTLFGYVSAILDTGAFVLSPTPTGSEKGMLVLGSSQVIPRLTATSRVEVRGEVRSFDRGRYKREVGVGLDVAVFGGWDQGPSLRAFWVRTLDSPTAEGPAPKGMGGSGSAGMDSSKEGTSAED